MFKKLLYILLDLFKYLYNLYLQEHRTDAHCRQKRERKRKERERLKKKEKINTYQRLYTWNRSHLGNGYCNVNVKNVIKRVRTTADVNAAK